MPPAKRPSVSPARTRPSPAPGALALGELQLVARTLDLPKLPKPSTGELVAQIKASAAAKQGGDASVCTALVHAAFKLIDKNGDGTLSRIEVVKALRDSAQVRELLQLPQKIRQEDGTRDLFEKVYQAIDTDDSKSITLKEFEAYFLPALESKRRPLGLARIGVSLAIVGVGMAYAVLLLRPALLQLLSASQPVEAPAAAAEANDPAAVVAAAESLASAAAAAVAKAAAAAAAADAGDATGADLEPSASSM
jgi:hypothetical protein|eukprot:Transcript_21726.p1 GENE.Transcript_21726~~Transcript_21726.p1  ORF type:complete len:261 (+),score=84.02 Transcript_21726:33-785(+)